MFHNSRINTKAGMGWHDIFTGRALRNIEILREAILVFPADIQRALLLTLTASIGQMSKMVFAITSRGKTTGAVSSKIEVGSWVIGYWCPKQHFEINVWNCFDLRAKKVLRGLVVEPPRFAVGDTFRDFETHAASAVVDGRGAVPMLNDVQQDSLQLVITDPPHGDRIPYLEMSEMWNAVLGVQPSLQDEVVVSNARERGKSLSIYDQMLSLILNASVDRLRDGGFIVLLFNSRHQAEWSAIQSLTNAVGVKLIGGLPLNYSARSVVQDNRAGSMKNDMIVIFSKGDPSSERLEILKSISGWTGDPISLGGN